jgi:flavin-dependent dehydrogenase
MDTCDVLIVGGGPAGSACAWALRRAGLDVVVVDRATFPRDKVCAGWITPQVVDELELDTTEYCKGRTFQPFTGFRVGLVDGDGTVETRYGTPVSYGIRRCEFDAYLLWRSGARLALGAPAAAIVRDHRHWIVNDAVRAPMLVGAGGHFCPVARAINPPTPRRGTARIVVAQEAEYEIDPGDEAPLPTSGETPELYFCRELDGYGWRVRKGNHINVGIGRLECRSLPPVVARFVAFLERSGKLRNSGERRWHGHAYLVSAPVRRRALDDGVLLVGDAAGLAWPQSGEGIRPAVQSGLFAAQTIVHAAGRYTPDNLNRYGTWLRQTFGDSPLVRTLSPLVPAAAWMPLARRLLANPAFVRNVVLDRGFLRKGSWAYSPTTSAALPSAP